MKKIYKITVLFFTFSISFLTTFAQDVITITWQADAGVEKSFYIWATPGESFTVTWSTGTTVSFVGDLDLKKIAHTYTTGGNYNVSINATNGNCRFTDLIMDGCKVSAMSISGAPLITRLGCYNNGNPITNTNITLNTSLQTLLLHNNGMSALPTLPNTLTTLWCSHNNLTSLNVSSLTQLTDLRCHNNQLTAINVASNVNLIELWCSNNELSGLNVGVNAALRYLYCYDNKITTGNLTLPAGSILTHLYSYRNHLLLSDLYAGHQKIATLNNKHLGHQTIPPQTAMEGIPVAITTTQAIFNATNTQYVVEKNGVTAPITDYTVSSGVLTFNASGTYVVRMYNTQIQSYSGHAAEVEFDVYVLPPEEMEVCAGKNVTFTATPINGGTTPSYRWLVNGTFTGGTASTYSYTPSNGDIVVVELTSNALCPNPTTVFSRGIIVRINPLPVVNISANPAAVCSGASSTLTATVTSGSTTAMTYTWYRGATQLGTTTVPTYNLSSLTLTANYSVSVLNSDGCIGTSSTVPVTVHTLPTVTVAASPATVCSGGAVTFTATPGGGTTPSMTYTWTIGGTAATTTSSTYSRILTTTATYSVSVINSNGCTSGSTTPQTVTVTPTVMPTITISASTNSVCSGTAVTYSSTVTNGGTSPGYQWRVNGTPVGGATASTYTYEPANGDVVTCVLTSNAVCANPTTVTSTPGITMIITTTVIPTLTIIAVPD